MRFAIAFLLLTTSAGPPHGSLIVIGGGPIGPEILKRFAELAGGLDAPVVVIPTAGAADRFDSSYQDSVLLRNAGFTNVSLLHTRDRSVADSERFVEPLRKARAVWIGGGRHWRLVDSYLNTRTHRELHRLLERGGVIAGTSAGATVQGSYMVRGAREGNAIMMARGYEEGFGFLRNVTIDQHLLRRRREKDLLPVVAKHPKLLGIGIDESTAIVVTGDKFEVIGESKVAIYEHGKPYYFLHPADRYDLKARAVIR